MHTYINKRPTPHIVAKNYTLRRAGIGEWRRGDFKFTCERQIIKLQEVYPVIHLPDLRAVKNLKQGGKLTTKKKMHKCDKLTICILHYCTILLSPKEGILAECSAVLMAYMLLGLSSLK